MKKLLKKRYLIPMIAAVVVAGSAVAAYAIFSTTVTANAGTLQVGGVAVTMNAVNNTQDVVLWPTATFPADNASLPTFSDFPLVDFQTVNVTNTSKFAEDISGTVTTGNATWDANLSFQMWNEGQPILSGHLSQLSSTQDFGTAAANQTGTLTIAVWLDSSVSNPALENGTPTITFTATAAQIAQ